MKRHIAYPKIQAYRNVIQQVNMHASYRGKDAQTNEPVYAETYSKPTIMFEGTVKLHGTNTGVCYNTEEGIWAQSRKQILSDDVKGQGHYGFLPFLNERRDYFQALLDSLIQDNHVDTVKNTIVLYGEWAGKGIQQGVGVSQLEKSFFIFGARVVNTVDTEDKGVWLETDNLRNYDQRIYNVQDFKTYNLVIDFNMPKLVQNTLAGITEEVEKECPVTKALGIDNTVGEGVVWSAYYGGNRYQFKVKGAKHSATKIKKLASVNVEKLKSIQAFVDYAVTENRYNQAIQEVFENNDLDVNKLGDVIRWIIKDITNEEADTLKENNLSAKDVNKLLSNKIRAMFFQQYRSCDQLK